MPTLHLKSDLEDKVKKIHWRRLLPGVFSSRIDLRSGETVSGIIKVENQVIPFGPIHSDKDSVAF